MLLVINSLQNILMEQPSIVSGSITVDVNNADINDADENKKDLNALWDFASRNKVARDNHDLAYQDVQKAIESCNGSQSALHTPENKIGFIYAFLSMDDNNPRRVN